MRLPETPSERISLSPLQGLEVIYEIADRVEAVQDRCRVNHDDFRTKFRPGLVEVVYEWARGMVSPSWPYTVCAHKVH